MNFRQLDMDDWVMLVLTAKGYTVTETARILTVSQPAVSQRLKRISKIFCVKIFKKQGMKMIADPEGSHVLKLAFEIVEIMTRTFPDATGYWRGKPLIHYVGRNVADGATGETNQPQTSGSPGTHCLHGPICNDAGEAMMFPGESIFHMSGKMI